MQRLLRSELARGHDSAVRVLILGKTKDWNRNELALPSSSTTKSDGQCCGGIVTAGNPPSSPSMEIANTFNETSLCTLENNGTKCVTSTTGIWFVNRDILNMERVMKVMIRSLNILTELDILNYLHAAPQLFHVCTSLSSNQISQNGLQSLLTLTNPQSEDSIVTWDYC